MPKEQQNVSSTLFSHHESDPRRGSRPSTEKQNVILTSILDFSKDSLRHKKVSLTYDFMANFYISVLFQKLNVIIFYNVLPKNFIERYETDKIKFVKVTVNESHGSHSFRFYGRGQVCCCN